MNPSSQLCICALPVLWLTALFPDRLTAAEPALVKVIRWQTVPNAFVPAPENVHAVPPVAIDLNAFEETCGRLRHEGLCLPFTTYPNGGEPLLESTAYVGFSDTFFAALLEGRQSQGYAIRANRQETEDGHIWYDDNFEVFVDPFLTRSEYIHFIVNALGEVFDQRCFEKRVPDPKAADPAETRVDLQQDTSYTSGTHVPVEKGESGWAALFCLPFSAFGLTAPPVGQIWGFNFCHTNRENDELTQWLSTPGSKGFHQPRRFGALRFGKPDRKLQADFRYPLPGVGTNILHIQTQNRERPVNALSIVSVTGPDGILLTNEKTPVEIPKGSATHCIPFPVPATAHGKCRVAAKLVSKGSTLAYFVRNHAFRDPMELTLPLEQIYATDPGVDGLLRVNIGEADLDRTKLVAKITRDNWTRSQPLAVRGNAARFRLSIEGLDPGTYTLTVSGPTVKAVCAHFTVIPAPFDF